MTYENIIRLLALGDASQARREYLYSYRIT